MLDFILNFGLPLAYVALGIATLVAIVFPVMQMATDFKKAKSALVGIGILVAIFLLSYVLADNQPLTTNYETMEGGQMKLIEAGLYLVYMLFAASLIAIVYASVSRYFK